MSRKSMEKKHKFFPYSSYQYIALYKKIILLKKNVDGNDLLVYNVMVICGDCTRIYPNR